MANATYGANDSLTDFVSGDTITHSFSYNTRLQPMNLSALSPLGTIFQINYDFHAGNGDNGKVFAIINSWKYN